MENKLILAVEPAVAGGSLSLLLGKREIARSDFGQTVFKSENLLASIEKLLSENDLKARAIDWLSFSEGPGSLTGLRVGTALMLGLKNALKIKSVQFNLLRAIANNAGFDDEQQLIGVPISRTKIGWILVNKEQQEFYETQQEQAELTTFIESFGLSKGFVLLLHESLITLFESIYFSDNCKTIKLINLGSNMAFYLGLEAAKLI